MMICIQPNPSQNNKKTYDKKKLTFTHGLHRNTMEDQRTVGHEVPSGRRMEFLKKKNSVDILTTIPDIQSLDNE